MATTTYQLADGRRFATVQDDDVPELVEYRLDGKTLTDTEADVLRRELRNGGSIGATVVDDA